MTATTGGLTPKPLGRIQRAIQLKQAVMARAGAPYILTYGTALAVAEAADLAGHVPDLPPLPVAVAAAAVMHASLQAWERRAWHRSGGKAAMRRRRAYQGHATRAELRRNLSPEVARRAAAITCPGINPARAPVMIGRAKGQDIAASREDSYLLVAPPRSGKTGSLACWVADAPGPALATSTRTDMHAHTAIPRGGLGELYVLNPDGDGDIPSTLRWSPVAGCENPAVAIQRAGYLMAAAPSDKGGKDAYWDAKGSDLLRLMLHAGALAGATMLEVTAWVRDPSCRAPAVILASEFAAPGWDRALAALRANEEQLGHVAAGAAAALRWMDDPAMARAACPSGDGFDAAQFLRDGTGTVYLIGADRPHGSLAPYFAAFAADLFEAAKRVASASPGGRLPAPLTLALDEAAITCPVPLHKWTAEAGGHGVTVMAAIQGQAQLYSRWGEHDGRTILKNSTVKMFWGGDTDAADLEAVSSVCGMADTWDHTVNPDGTRTRTPRQERLFPPERIRMLGRNQVLVLHRNTRPVIVRTTPAWDQPWYQRAMPGQPGTAQQAAAARPAITAPRREPIPMPHAAPAAITWTGPVPALSGPEAVTPVPDYPPEIPAPAERENPWHATTGG